MNILLTNTKNIIYNHKLNKMEKKEVKITVADPTTLGLFGLALVTLVASSQKLGMTEGVSYLVPWAIFLGGIAQIIASTFDFKHNNLFGATAFAAYGLFWVSMAAGWLINMGVFGEALASGTDVKQLGFVFIGYLLLSIVLTISALKMSKVMFVLMVFICILFLTLAMDSLGMGHIWHTMAAWVELTISILSFYALGAKYLNSFFGKELIKCGAPIIK